MKKVYFYLLMGRLFFIVDDVKADVYIGVGAGLTTLTGTASFNTTFGPPANFSTTLKTQQNGQAFSWNIFLGYFQKNYGYFSLGLEGDIDFSKPQSNHSVTVPQSFVAPGSARTFKLTIQKDPVVNLAVKFNVNVMQNVIPFIKFGTSFAHFSYLVSRDDVSLTRLKRQTIGFTASLGVRFKVTTHFFITAEGNFAAYPTIRFPDVFFQGGSALTQLKNISQTHSFRLCFGYFL